MYPLGFRSQGFVLLDETQKLLANGSIRRSSGNGPQVCPPVTNFASLSTRGNSGVAIFTQPIETILRLNAGVISAFQSATVSWIQRRQEAAKEGIESFGKLVCCRDIGEAMAIQREWVERSLHRLDEDFSAFANQAPEMLPDAEPEVTVVATTSEAAAQLPAPEIENHSHAPDQTDQKNRRTKKKGPPNQRTKSARSSSHGRRR